jgi:ribose-phosphate pyrophosphokinase
MTTTLPGRATGDTSTEAPHSWTLAAGTGNPALAAAVAAQLGVTPCVATVDRFPDGEVSVELGESVRGRDVFILDPTSPPVNEHLAELIMFADACRRADARRITAIVPYFGYARSDKRQGRRTPVAARAVADLIEGVGIAHVVTLDAHTPQLEGFFRIPIDDLSAVHALSDALRARLPAEAVIVSPDLGGVRRATAYSDRLGRPTALCVKRRESATTVAVTQVIGDVRGRPCVIVDDMISTGGTIAESAKALRAVGARGDFVAVATHGLLVPGARERMRAAGVIELVVSDSIAIAREGEPATTCVTVAPLLADAVRRLAVGDSLRDLH